MLLFVFRTKVVFLRFILSGTGHWSVPDKINLKKKQDVTANKHKTKHKKTTKTHTSKRKTTSPKEAPAVFSELDF